jgi:hypothetical protein
LRRSTASADETVDGHPRAGAGFFGTYLIAVVLHTAWDGANDIAVYAVLSAISLGLLTLTAHRIATAERLAAAQQAPLPRFVRAPSMPSGNR